MIGHSRLTRNTLGTAADKILAGDVTAAQIDEIIAGCHWCNPCIPNQCWHQAARVLFDHGLRQ